MRKMKNFTKFSTENVNGKVNGKCNFEEVLRR